MKCHAIKGEGSKIGPDLGKIDLGDTRLDLAKEKKEDKSQKK